VEDILTLNAGMLSQPVEGLFTRVVKLWMDDGQDCTQN
jgi:hypothetical protein